MIIDMSQDEFQREKMILSDSEGSAYLGVELRQVFTTSSQPGSQHDQARHFDTHFANSD